MFRTPLYDRFTADGAPAADFAGALTASGFGDRDAEIRALLNGCAVFDLGYRAKLLITGDDRVRWTNGMLTNNTRDLAVNQGVYSFVLNTKGRIEGDLFVCNRDLFYVADTDISQREKLIGIFHHYIIMDKVEIADVSDRLTAIGVEGPAAAAVLSQAGLSEIPEQPVVIHDAAIGSVGFSIVRKPAAQPSFELWVAPADVETMWDLLVDSGATPVGAAAREAVRVFHGVPRFGPDINDAYLPQETGQQQALHFNKGCYVGQEIVERIHSRGNVHRGLTGFILGGSLEPAGLIGGKVRVEGKDAGEITSAAAFPVEDGQVTLALGYARRETLRPGAAVEVNGAAAAPSPLPFGISSIESQTASQAT